MFKKIKEYLNKREEAKFKANMTDAKIYSERLRKLYPDLDIDWDYSEEKYDEYGNAYRDKEIIAIVACSDYCIDDDKAIKQFVKNGGLIIYLDDKNRDKKIEILDKKGIPFMLVSEECYLEFNNENRRIDWQKEL